MNFYIVPSALYQTQQKLSKKRPKKRSSRHSSTSAGSERIDSHSLRSSTTQAESMKSLPESPESETVKESSHKILVVDAGGITGYHPNSEHLRGSVDSRTEDSSHHQLAPTSISSMKLHDQERRMSSVTGPGDLLTNNRTNSITSSNASKTSGLGRKMSYSQVPTASLSSQVPPGAVDIRPELFGSNAISESPSHKPQFHIPKFRPLTDLSVLNHEQLLRKNFFNPIYMATRYKTFLNILSEHHLSDPMNFAAVRDHSLLKFMNRHLMSKIEREKGGGAKTNGDIRYYEGLISYELLQCRSFLRELINLQSKEDRHRSSTITCEELLQVNFINYVRYLLNLPNVLPVAPEKLDEILARHYHFRSFFGEMSMALYSLKKEGYSDDMATPTSDVDILVETITKVSYEFILLEKYVIHILVKLNHNSIVEHRIASHLFSLFDLNMKLEKKESLKILNFNTYFSSQYSWYMAITTPFVRVFEANIHGEDPEITSDYDAYQRHLSATANRKNFKETDAQLYEDYFRHLKFKDYELFCQLSRGDLVDLQRSLNAEKFAGQTMDDNNFQFKPPNFEYFTESLTSLESETFHVIQSRDISLQLSRNDFRVIVSEFHRLLKKGGVLELPLVESGDDLIHNLPDSRISLFPNLPRFMDLEVAQAFDLVPSFLVSLLSELSRLFGAKNVKFSSVLLSAKNDMNNFLIRHTAFSVYEIYGDADGFCSRFASEENSNKREILHYYFYIRAEKA